MGLDFRNVKLLFKYDYSILSFSILFYFYLLRYKCSNRLFKQIFNKIVLCQKVLSDNVSAGNIILQLTSNTKKLFILFNLFIP